MAEQTELGSFRTINKITSKIIYRAERILFVKQIRGYHSYNHAAKAYGVVINPNKSEPITFSERDKVIVFAED